ncbi:hypothetical protein [Psychroserpens sp. SPM9]|uniref:hypothetical protein n=1 Tax=Psychroserpens sp. SPM9 TaxID=2975598 RepID=UPI0021A49698|nr:hypothetical protein [Psychroserpens sp. SPM9]MDG5493179.1 hypothetical protein [Psychroserpens sp. SPM9]
MKIEFEVDRSEALVLLKGLKHLMGITSNPKTIKIIHDIIKEIEEDGKANDFVFENLDKETANYRNMNFPFKMMSHLKNDLKMNDPFINSTYGLRQRCQKVLTKLTHSTKPGKPIPHVSLSKVKQCKTVKDLVHLIVEDYENI